MYAMYDMRNTVPNVCIANNTVLRLHSVWYKGFIVLNYPVKLLDGVLIIIPAELSVYR